MVVERPEHHPLTAALDEMAEVLLEHTKRTKACSELCALRFFEGPSSAATYQHQHHQHQHHRQGSKPLKAPLGAGNGGGASKLVARNRALQQAYVEVLNGRNDSRNFLTNWFTWTERYRSPAAASASRLSRQHDSLLVS